MATGEIVVLWQTPSVPDFPSDEVQGRIYSATGRALSGVFVVGDGVGQEDPDIEALPGGGLVVTYMSGSLKKGVILKDHFTTNVSNKAKDAEDRFICNVNNDQLWYDSNGSKAGGTKVMIADLGTTDFVLSYQDISIA